jgi:spermidine/putrescine transport system permease protein
VKPPSPSLYGAAALLYLFLYAPIAVVIVFSFNTARHGVRWEGFTLQWYRVLAENEQAWLAAKNTLVLALLSTLLATALGTLLGFGLSRYRVPAKRLISRALYLPVFIPDIVMAVSLLLFYSVVRRWLGLFQLGLSTMILAHVTFQIPFVAIVVRTRLAGLDPALEEAAHDLGANAWQVFWSVTFPLMIPGIVAGGMLAFTLSLDDFVVSFFTSGAGSTTLPILIYSSVKRGITPDINALSTLIVAASVAAIFIVALLRRNAKL